MRPHTLRGDIFRRFDFQAKRVAIERERRGKIANGNADVVENSFHDSCNSEFRIQNSELDDSPHCPLQQRVCGGIRVDFAGRNAIDEPCKFALGQNLIFQMLHEPLGDEFA